MYQGFAAQQNQASLARANAWGNVSSSLGNIATAAMG